MAVKAKHISTQKILHKKVTAQRNEYGSMIPASRSRPITAESRSLYYSRDQSASSRRFGHEKMSQRQPTHWFPVRSHHNTQSSMRVDTWGIRESGVGGVKLDSASPHPTLYPSCMIQYYTPTTAAAEECNNEAVYTTVKAGRKRKISCIEGMEEIPPKMPRKRARKPWRFQ